MSFRVAIMGAGVAAGALHRAFDGFGVSHDIFSYEPCRTACGIRPCGWYSDPEILPLLRQLGVGSSPISELHSKTVMDGREMKVKMVSLDKTRLVSGLLHGANINRCDSPRVPEVVLREYNIIIDATGFERAYSPPIDKELVALNYELRVRVSEPYCAMTSVIRGGYVWHFPLEDGHVHIGGGSTLLPMSDIAGLVKQWARHFYGPQINLPSSTVCACAQPMRLSGPIFPLVNGKVVAVGEAAGLVHPFGGAGIRPALESGMALAHCLVSHADWQRYYETWVRRRFGWLRNQRRILDSLNARSVIPLRYSVDAYRALCYMGVKPTLADLLFIKRTMEHAWQS